MGIEHNHLALTAVVGELDYLLDDDIRPVNYAYARTWPAAAHRHPGAAAGRYPQPRRFPRQRPGLSGQGG